MSAFRVTPGSRHVLYIADQDTDDIRELYRAPLVPVRPATPPFVRWR